MLRWGLLRAVMRPRHLPRAFGHLPRARSLARLLQCLGPPRSLACRVAAALTVGCVGGFSLCRLHFNAPQGQSSVPPAVG
eukprot:975240-Alexandrium_andersonii.AAC.1